MYQVDEEQLSRLRAFAQEPGALFMTLQGPHGPVPIWAEDIIAASTDDELLELVCKAMD
jgi:hypothetical protein